MCELLGLNFNEPVTCSFSLRVFSKRSNKHPDGWGIGRYNGKKFVITKEPIKSSTSALSKAVENNRSITSNIFIGHVRSASGTEVSIFNTHSFSHKFRDHDFMLAHNDKVMKSVPIPSLNPSQIKFGRQFSHIYKKRNICFFAK